MKTLTARRPIKLSLIFSAFIGLLLVTLTYLGSELTYVSSIPEYYANELEESCSRHWPNDSTFWPSLSLTSSSIQDLEWSYLSDTLYFLQKEPESIRSTLHKIPPNGKISRVYLDKQNLFQVYDIELSQSSNQALIASHSEGLFYIENLSDLYSFKSKWLRPQIMHIYEDGLFISKPNFDSSNNIHFAVGENLVRSQNQDLSNLIGSNIVYTPHSGIVKGYSLNSTGKLVAVNTSSISHDQDMFIGSSDTNQLLSTIKNSDCLANPKWSPIQDIIVYTQINPDGTSDIFYLNVADPNKKATNITNNPNKEFQVSWSPDGRFLGYISKSDEFSAQKSKIMIFDFTLMTSKEVYSADGAKLDLLRWSPSSEFLAFVEYPDANTKVYAIDIYSQEIFFNVEVP